jgi:hypothetical protein
MLRSQVGKGAFVPLWLLKKDISASAVRMWAILRADYADQNNRLSPSRGELAADLNISTDSIDRHMRELAGAGAVDIRKKIKDGTNGQHLPNEYILVDVDPSSEAAATVAVEKRPSELAASFVEQEISVVRKTHRETLVRSKEPISFIRFWDEYPRKCSKQETLRIWLKRGVEHDAVLRDAIMSGVRRHRSAWEQEQRETRYMPYPDKFLRKKMYLDEVMSSTVRTPTLAPQTQAIISASAGFLARRQKEKR